MPSPTDRRYSQTHEWYKPDGDTVTVGISQFAVDELTDITFLEVLTTEGQLKKGDVLGEIESVKATSEIYSALDGEVVAVNQEAVDNPALLNEDPYDKGWLIQLRLSDPAQLEALMTAEQYDQQQA
ncbi:MAG: glycine cleavage system protein GcvH [Phycisphaeraceae bacterium]